MMDLDEAIQHCEEVADTPCFTDEEAKCYSEHRQLAEWLKELKAYREGTGMKLLIDIPEHIYEHAKEMTEDSRDEGEAMRAIANGTPTRCRGVDEAEKERLIKKNMLSIENRVRNVFNQGYEMGVKKNRSEIPTSCEDAISRQAVIDIITFEDKWLLDAKSHNKDTEIAFSSMKSKISEMPSVTPQQRTGRWIQKEEEDEAEPFIIWECSECHCVDEDGKPSYKYCPQCGAKMEVEE